MKISLRRATVSDAPFIAKNILAAMGFDVFGNGLPDDMKRSLEVLTSHVCNIPYTLYSYENTLIAEVEDEQGNKSNAGSMTAYDGAKYKDMRAGTFGIIESMTGFSLGNSEAETDEGEFYLDSLAVLPEYRGHGIAGMLLEGSVAAAFEAGFTRVTLLVDEEKPRLQALYASHGFSPLGRVLFMGEHFIKMERIR